MSRPLRPFCRQLGLLACLLFAIAVGACSAPVKVDRVDLRTAYGELNRTALSSDQLSEATRTVLRRAALLEVFDNWPDVAITALPVADTHGRLVGALNVHDLMRAGVV